MPTCTAEDVARRRTAPAPAQVSGLLPAPRGRAPGAVPTTTCPGAAGRRSSTSLQVETGKARISAFEELADVALTARYYANTAPKHSRPARRQGALPG